MRTCSQPGLESAVVGRQLGACRLDLLGGEHGGVGVVHGRNQVVGLVHDHYAASQPHAQRLPGILHSPSTPLSCAPKEGVSRVVVG